MKTRALKIPDEALTEMLLSGQHWVNFEAILTQVKELTAFAHKELDVVLKNSSNLTDESFKKMIFFFLFSTKDVFAFNQLMEIFSLNLQRDREKKEIEKLQFLKSQFAKLEQVVSFKLYFRALRFSLELFNWSNSKGKKLVKVEGWEEYLSNTIQLILILLGHLPKDPLHITISRGMIKEAYFLERKLRMKYSLVNNLPGHIGEVNQESILDERSSKLIKIFKEGYDKPLKAKTGDVRISEHKQFFDSFFSGPIEAYFGFDNKSVLQNHLQNRKK